MGVSKGKNFYKPGIPLVIMLMYHQAKNGFTIANTWSFVSGSSNASEAAAADIIFPPILVIATPACVTFSSPL